MGVPADREEPSFSLAGQLYSQYLAEGTVGSLHPCLVPFGFDVRRLPVGMKVKHVGRDAKDFGELLDQVILGRITVIMLHRVEIGWIDGPPIFAPQA